MLFGVTGGAQRNRVAIAGLDRYPTIGSSLQMRSFRWLLCRRLRTGADGQKPGAVRIQPDL